MNKIRVIGMGVSAFLVCTNIAIAAPKQPASSPPSMEVTGRIQANTAVYDHDRTPMGDGTELRRARLGVQGTVFKSWDYKLSVDFAGNQVDIKDAFIAYTRFKPLVFLMGQYKQPFSLEELTSSKYRTFIETALPNIFAVGRKLGLGARAYGKLDNNDVYTVALGLFGEEQNVDVDNEGNEGRGVAARATMTHFFSKHRLVGGGASIAYICPKGNNTVQYNPRPESHVTNVRLVDTGQILNVNSYAVYGLEGVAQFNPVVLQGEFISPSLNRKRGLSDPHFYGWYGQASWMITGESREYDSKEAVFKGVTPGHRYGAWELAGRFSDIDLNSKDILGGREEDITAGLNWYPNHYIRFMFNYVKAFSKRNGINDDPNIYMLGAQVFFSKKVG